jgi:hypothetical protein
MCGTPLEALSGCIAFNRSMKWSSAALNPHNVFCTMEMEVQQSICIEGRPVQLRLNFFSAEASPSFMGLKQGGSSLVPP